jgi:hypothetical protein
MFDALIQACPLSYLHNGSFVVDCDMVSVVDLCDPLQFEDWMVELVALCGTQLHAVHYHAADGVRTVYY